MIIFKFYLNFEFLFLRQFTLILIIYLLTAINFTSFAFIIVKFINFTMNSFKSTKLSKKKYN